MKTCSKCGLVKTYDEFSSKSSMCKTCKRENNHLYYINRGKEYRRTQAKNYTKEQRKEEAERVGRYRDTHREQIREKDRDRYAKNPEKLREKSRLYWALHPESVALKHRDYRSRVLADPIKKNI